MTAKSIAEVYRLPETIRQGFGDDFHPYIFGVSPYDDARPIIVIPYDCDESDGRVKHLGLNRRELFCTHGGIGVFAGAGEAPVCVGFGAACLHEVFENGKYKRVREDLRHVANNIFGHFKGNAGYRVLTKKALRERLRKCVEGVVMDESDRHFDACQIIAVSDRQAQKVMDFINQVKENPPDYALWSGKGINCRDFYLNALQVAGIPAPAYPKILGGYEPISYPTWELRKLVQNSDGRLKQHGEWWLQPPVVTAQMRDQAHQKLWRKNAGLCPEA